ncbi:MAG: serine/threonine protein kinase [Planctomycetaceae bacterium]|nr:serine/threonine protein kinase [Planctomycetaceae bacterium]
MSPDHEQHPVDQLAEEFARRIRAGETPVIEDYCQTYPEHADLIRAVFPSVQLVERASQREDQQRKSGVGSSAALLSMPQTLGDFRLLREIGRGGMGVVYEAEQKSLKRHVALKVISALIANSEKQLQRFRREAESAGSLHHSNIVPVYGIGEDHGLQYYAMQLIDGVPLSDVIRQIKSEPLAASSSVIVSDVNGERSNTKPDGPPGRWAAADAAVHLFGTIASVNLQTLHSTESTTNRSIAPQSAGDPQRDDQTCVAMHTASHLDSLPCDSISEKDIRLSQAYIRNVVKLLTNVANAVDYAHRQGILHRDLKPANLILDREGTIWVADFGLARQAVPDGVTQTGEIVGTLRYMAPEQLRGQADSRTDVYALGLTLYELLALRPALDGPQLLNGRSHQAITRLRTIRPEIPADLETITLKACMAEPERRYQSARELEADLHRFLQDRPILARRVTSVERLWRWSKRNPWIASLATITMLLLVTVAIILGISNHRIQKALVAGKIQYERAELNLAEKTAALANAERERIRAETNLDLAVSAFEEVFNNIAARGQSETLLEELSDDEIVPAADAVLSNADVTLLETLLGFFDRLAVENSKDLSIESAAARRRVGDIQQQLGRLEDARTSYQTTLNAYARISAEKTDDSSLVLAQAGILHQMMMTSAKTGEIPKAMQELEELRKVLAAAPHVSQSPDARFILATAINSLVSIGLRTAVEPRNRGRALFFNRLPATSSESPSPPQNERLRRTLEANIEALEILNALTKEHPSSVAYRVALAQATKDRARILQLSRDWSQADETLNHAIGILENLQQEFPESDRFKYELAETLSTRPSPRPGDMQRLTRSLQLSRELVDAHPGVPEYRSLYATALVRMAAMQIVQGKSERAEATLKQALTQQQQLADQFPDVFMYQFAVTRTLQHMAHFYTEGKQPELAREALDSAIKRLEEQPVRTGGRNPVNMLLNRLRESRAKLND